MSSAYSCVRAMCLCTIMNLCKRDTQVTYNSRFSIPISIQPMIYHHLPTTTTTTTVIFFFSLLYSRWWLYSGVFKSYFLFLISSMNLSHSSCWHPNNSNNRVSYVDKRVVFNLTMLLIIVFNILVHIRIAMSCLI